MVSGGHASERKTVSSARLVRRLLESDYPALKSLMYKLDPMDFTDEDVFKSFCDFLKHRL